MAGCHRGSQCNVKYSGFFKETEKLFKAEDGQIHEGILFFICNMVWAKIGILSTSFMDI